MRRIRTARHPLAVLAMLMVSCGGPGPGNEEAPRAEAGSHTGGGPVAMPPGVTLNVTGSAEPDPDVMSAERDLGLVDWDLGVRIGTAGGDAGLLDPEQFRLAMLDESATVRRSAVDGLHRFAPSALTRLLPELDAALEDSDDAVRESVVEQLAGLEDPRAIVLLRRASRDPSPLVRVEARAGLTALGVRVPGARTD